jgi:hypothetical protein
MTTTEQDRAAFEVFFGERGWKIDRIDNPSGYVEFKNHDTMQMWIGWRAALAYARERQAEREKLPISTAPKDGTWFVAFENEDSYPCSYEIEEPDEGPGKEGWYDYFNQSFENPSHWLPLPQSIGADFWQPMSTAPKTDGRPSYDQPRFMAYFGDTLCEGYYDPDEHASRPRPFWNTAALRIQDARNNQPIAWKPLPERPILAAFNAQEQGR